MEIKNLSEFQSKTISGYGLGFSLAFVISDFGQ